MNIKKNVMKAAMKNNVKIAGNLGKLAIVATAVAWVTPMSKEIGKETIELVGQQVRLVRNIVGK